MDGTLTGEEVVWGGSSSSSSRFYPHSIIIPPIPPSPLLVSDDLHFKVFSDFLRPLLGIDIDEEFYEEKIHGKHNAALVSRW